MLRSKKLFVCVLVVLTVFTMSANATVSRLVGLGGASDMAWWDLPGNIFVLHDAATPGIWPQLIQQYPNLAGGEFYTPITGYDANNNPIYGAWDLQKVYVNYTFNEKRTVVQFMLDKPSSIRFFRTGFAINPDNYPGNPSRLNLLFGTKLGEDMLVGAALSYSGASTETKDDPATTGIDEATKFSTSVFGIKVGVSGIGKNEWDVELGLEIPSFTNEAGSTKVSEKDGGMGFHAAGRYWWNYYEKCALIPNVRFMTLTDGAKYTAAFNPPDLGHKITDTEIAIGVGHNWWPVENTLVLFDFGVKLFTEKHEFTEAAGVTAPNYDVKSNALPYWRAGFETTIFSWLDGRLGAERNWFSDKLSGTAEPTEPKLSTSETVTFLGATAHWNRLILDLVVQPAFIGNGPNFISGANSGQMFSQVSLKYDFNQ